MKKIAILGSTGSIGRQCFKVIDAHPGRFEVVALAAGSNIALAAEQVAKYRPQVVSVATESGARELCAALKKNRGHKDPAQPGLEILFGAEGIERVATHPDAEMVVSAAVGVVGLPATYKAIEQGKQIALANKEVLVAAGEVVMAAVKRHGTVLLPVDSEHNAIHQCLRAGQRSEVKRLILTASGGPFRTTSLAKIAKATPKQALAHPNWKMGQRITIDSATPVSYTHLDVYKRQLHGIPWGGKDLLDTAGIPTTYGAEPFRNRVPAKDAAVVQRLNEAGAVLVAKLSLGSLALNDVWFGGQTMNPWLLEEGSSGSSAGPGAATAAALVGFSIGSETGGSIVSPSMRCGVTGLRPTYGRVPRTGAMTLCWSLDKLSLIHILSAC